MKNRWITHLGWGFPAIAAFGVGSQFSAWKANDHQLDAELARKAGGSGMSQDSEAIQRTFKSKTRDKDMESGSLLDRLFGSSSADSATIKGLAQQAFTSSNPIVRRLAFGRFLESMTPENAEAMRMQMVKLGADQDQWKDFHFSWGALAGEQAFVFAASSEDRDLAPVLSGWAAANPAAALAMLENLPAVHEGQRAELEESVVAGLAATNSNLAADFVMRLASQGRGDVGKLMETVAKEVLRAGGAAEASRWAEGLLDGNMKGVAMAQIAGKFFELDPLAASKWAARFADKTYATQMIEQGVGPWVQRDPVTAVSWLESLPAGNGKNAGLSAAFGDWEDSNPGSASEHLLSMPDSPARDAAISGFSNGYAWQNPRVAIDWAQSISEPNLRAQSLARAGQIYFRRNPTSAQAWLDGSNLSAEMQTAIRQPMR